MTFKKPLVARDAFDRVVKQAIARIPLEIRKHLDNILISVQQRPDPGMLNEMGLPPDEMLFGVYYGVPLNERTVSDPPLYPDTIFLFQEPLQQMCADQDELIEEIEITVVHEIAHALGLSDADLESLGYG